ncbi:MAG TPA: hypothetical protein VF471_06225 [Pseudoxanthomonas sp.]
MAIEIKHDDDHTIEVLDEAAMTFMTLVTHRLNAALEENGISDSEERQEICAHFMFGLSYDLDAGWFQEGETRFFPKVCFLERARPAEGENLGTVKVVHIPSEASSWHEYAHGVVSEYFEEGETLGQGVRTGSYENENE